MHLPKKRENLDKYIHTYMYNIHNYKESSTISEQ